jgi:hypothetical protein
MMEPDRFDDVAFTVTEEPQELSPRSRLRRRMTAVLTAATIVFGGMAAAADALTQSSQPAGSSASPTLIRDGDGARQFKRHHPCREGDRDHRGASTSELRY